MREYLVYRDNKEMFEQICKRDNLEYEVRPSREHFMYKMDISRARFREILADIEAEKLRNSTKSDVPYITAKTLSDPTKLEKVLAGRKSFRMTEEEFKKIDN